jgi:hypothetical protein
MQLKLVIGALIVAMLVGLGVLAGTVIGSSRAAAQQAEQAFAAVPAAAQSTPQSTATPGTTAPSKPGTGEPGEGNGKHAPGGYGGFGPGGMGRGFGGGGFGIGPGPAPGDFGQGGPTSANAASRVISSTANLIGQVKSDLAYANGKMDTTDTQRWVTGAESLLKSAQDANASSHYGQAVAYARASGQLAEVAETQMAQKLGADKLPSNSQRPQRPNRPANPSQGTTTTTPTQAEASRVLRNTYNQLVSMGALVKNASSAGDAATYLTDAQNQYKNAYNSYQSGNYSDALASARLAEELGGVANSVLQAVNEPNDSTTPVTVPAPNF